MCSVKFMLFTLETFRGAVATLLKHFFAPSQAIKISRKRREKKGLRHNYDHYCKIVLIQSNELFMKLSRPSEFSNRKKSEPSILLFLLRLNFQLQLKVGKKKK